MDLEYPSLARNTVEKIPFRSRQNPVIPMDLASVELSTFLKKQSKFLAALQVLLMYVCQSVTQFEILPFYSHLQHSQGYPRLPKVTHGYQKLPKVSQGFP